jgi:protein TonB
MLSRLGDLPPAEQSRIAAWLERSKALNDAFAPTLSDLAEMRIASRSFGEAVTLATRAASLEPGSAAFRLTLARALWGASRQAEALGQGREALRVSTTDRERAAAQRWLDAAQSQTAQSPAAQRPARQTPAVSSPAPTSASRPADIPRLSDVAAEAEATPPRPQHEEYPRYTKAALEAKIEGDVTVECVVLADGSVGDVKVVKSLDRRFGLDEEAVKAAKLWRFEPATKGGEPVSAVVTLDLTFRLK